MRVVARGVIVIGCVLASLVGGVALAQDKPADTMDLLRDKVRADKRVVVAAVLELTEAEARGFWPVYNAYQSDMIGHYDRLLTLIEDYARSYTTMTDEKATKLLGDYLALEGDNVAVLNGYVPRFRKVLPARKLVRLYQVENKVRAMVNYELARQIPFLP
jgi:hypothetical protein